MTDVKLIDFNFDDYSELHLQYLYAMSLCQLSSIYIDDINEHLTDSLDYCAIVETELSFDMISSFFDNKLIDYNNNMLNMLHNDILHHESIVLYYYANIQLLICRTASLFELILNPKHKFKTYVQICQLDCLHEDDKFVKLIHFYRKINTDDVIKAQLKISSLTKCISDIKFLTTNNTCKIGKCCVLSLMPFNYIRHTNIPKLLRYCITDCLLYIKNNVLDHNKMQQLLRYPNLVAIGRYYSALLDMNCTLYSFVITQILQLNTAVLCYDMHVYDSHLYYTMCSKIANDNIILNLLNDFNNFAGSFFKIINSNELAIHFE